MKILKVSVVALAILVAVSSVWLFISSNGKNDAPSLQCSVDKTIEASVNVTNAELLSYVTAADKQDGDLTSQIVVSRKNFFISQNTTAVTFSVCDSDSNVTTLTRQLHFTDYKSPKIILTNDFLFPAGKLFDLSNYVAAADVIDGDISERVKAISDSYSGSEGRYDVNIKVSNSMADTSELNVTAIVTSDDYANLRIRLTDYITYISVGTEVDYSKFLSNVINKTAKDYTVDDVVVDASEVDVTKAGVYNVYYRILEGRGDSAATVSLSRLVVVVEEA
jgi:hypothetical protein